MNIISTAGKLYLAFCGMVLLSFTIAAVNNWKSPFQENGSGGSFFSGTGGTGSSGRGWGGSWGGGK